MSYKHGQNACRIISRPLFYLGMYLQTDRLRKLHCSDCRRGSHMQPATMKFPY